MIIEFVSRIRQSVFALLVTFTILLCTVWQGVLYPFGLSSKPSGRRMTSTFVGEAIVNDRMWGKIVGAIIDRIFLLLGDKPNHCVRSYQRYKDMDDD